MECVVHFKGTPHGRAARKKGGDVPRKARLVDAEIGHNAVSHADSNTGVLAKIR